MRKLLLVTAGVLMFVIAVVHSASVEKRTIESVIKQLQVEKDNNKKKILREELRAGELPTRQDMIYIRSILKNEKHDSDVVAWAMESLKYLKKSEFAVDIAGMVDDEEEFIKKVDSTHNESDKEGARRAMNTVLLIRKLGELKDTSTVPTIKKMLKYKYTQYYASESLAAMGDNSASNEIKTLMEQGADINYGGLGLDEAKEVIQDLLDVGKKDKWPKLARQINEIKDPGAKPYLKKLFNHENSYIKTGAAATYSMLVGKSDKGDIIAMAKNTDASIRCSAIDAMKKIRDDDFAEVLIALLKDPEYLVRLYAAKAIGYKKITKAIPYLEKVLNDENLRVRQESFIALYILTGKKYAFIGRDLSIEQQAEIQKKAPSFY